MAVARTYDLLPPGSPGLEVAIPHMPESFLQNRKTQEAIDRLWQGVLTRQKIERDFIGLAAPQIGILKSIIVMLVPGSILVFVNPEIVSSSREQNSAIERCISLDHRIHGLMWRANSINVRAFDAFGVQRSYTFQGVQARAFQHLYDHLQGVLLPEKKDHSGCDWVEPAQTALYFQDPFAWPRKYYHHEDFAREVAIVRAVCSA